MPSILDRYITEQELQDFSRFYNIARPEFDGDVLFPDQKTQSLQATYTQLSSGYEIPTMAQVHAFDTEARIGDRPTAKSITLEKLYIKEKINISESLAYIQGTGVQADDPIINFIFDDISNMMDRVRTRTEVAKMEVMATGGMTVNENGLNMSIDFGVPSTQKVTTNWIDADADIIGEIQGYVDTAAENGVTLTDAYCSQKVISYFIKNKGIQNAINGTVLSGIMLTLPKVNELFGELFGITIHRASNGLYKYTAANGDKTSKRFYPDNKITFYSSTNGAVGVGLWGPTPGELAGDASNGFITTRKWETNDPIATWTEAAGLMIPVLPNPYNLFIATVDSTEAITAVTISGTAKAGQELTAVVTPDLADASYQWYVADTSNGTYTKITNAVKSTYTVPTSKVGKFLKVEAKGAGKFSGTVTSAATTAVVAA